MHSLSYTQPASRWEEALPVGNGALGGMIFGGTGRERIQLNEESIWYGGKMHRQNPDAKESLPAIRQALLDGRIAEAERMMKRSLSGTPASMHPYQPLGDLFLQFQTGGAVTDYCRSLDLSAAVAKVSYRQDGVRYSREIFASAPENCLVLLLKADRPGSISLEATLHRGPVNGFQLAGKYYDGSKKLGTNGVCLYGNLGRGGYEFAFGVQAFAAGGTVRAVGDTLCVEGADQLLLLAAAESTYHCTKEEKQAAIDDCPLPEDDTLCLSEREELRMQQGLQQLLEKRLRERLERAASLGYAALYERHLSDYRSYFDRVRLTLDGDPAAEALPTDQRLLRRAEGKADPGLDALYFDYGRYLLISCSRPGTLAATLQGLWNQDYAPAWDSKYTININTQMNYWPAEICGLSDCHQPLFDLIERMRANGRRTAREMYGCRGFVCHHNTDIHGDTDVQDTWIPGSYWVMGAAWLCTHLWTHYRYTRDEAFLAEAFPVISEAALFFLDYLIDVDGYRMTCPSVSPENSYLLPNGEQGANGVGVTMDNQILRDLFGECLAAAELLPRETAAAKLREIGVADADGFLAEVRYNLEHLLPTRIGSDGRILEWREEYAEVEPGHRHISHLYGLSPSDQITPDGTPELATAARRTLERRLSLGGGHTGWSCAWILNHYARLWDGEAAYETLDKLLTRSTYPNLFDMHPPFQIDGNFGGTAGIAQMLVQSNESRVLLLPALPQAWRSGAAEGLRIVGDGAVSLWWEDGRLTRFTLRAGHALSTTVCCGEKSWAVALQAGEQLEVCAENGSL